jgi:precorrin-6B methylase 2
VSLVLGAHDAQGQGSRGRLTVGPRSGAGVQIFSPGARHFFQSSGITIIDGRTLLAPRRPVFVPPIPVFRAPAPRVFHRFGPGFVHPVFPRRTGVLIIEVPSVIGTTGSSPWVAPGVTYFAPPALAAGQQQIPGRFATQLAPFDPSPQEVVERLLALAALKKGDVLYDLGSGDGRILITAAKTYGVKAVGFEIDPGLVKLARENVRRQQMEEWVEIRQQDFMTADLSPASVVTLYLSSDGNLALKHKLMRELKPGARVVSYMFDMGDWAPKIAETYRDTAGDSHLLYFWQISEPMVFSENSASIP